MEAISVHFANTKYGFQYGACEVTRIHQTQKGEVYLQITTERETLDIKVTPTGMIRYAKKMAEVERRIADNDRCEGCCHCYKDTIQELTKEIKEGV